MSDDLFEFLVVHEMGRATEEAQLPAEVRSIIDKIKSHKRSECGQRKFGNA